MTFRQSASAAPRADTLAYASAEDGSLRIVNAGEDRSRELVRGVKDTEVTNFISWSPDGQWLAYILSKLTGSGDSRHTRYQGLWRIRADGRNATELYTMGDNPQDGLMTARWSPDHQSIWFWRVPYFSGSFMADGLPLQAISFNGGAPRELAPQMLLNSDFMAVSPDG